MPKVAWEDAKKTAESYKSGGKFLRLVDDGQKFIGAFVGEPAVREHYYNEKTKQYEAFTPRHRDEGKSPSAKFSINVYVPARGGEKPEPRSIKIFEMSGVTFKDVLKVREKYGLEKWLFEVSREGKKGDTKTSYSILPDVQLTDEQREEIKLALSGKDANFKLHDLDTSTDEDDEKADLNSADAAAGKKNTESKAEPKAESKTEANGHANGANGHANTGAPPAAGETISGEQAGKLVERLKALPKDTIEKFLAEFGVKKVRELPANRFDDAVTFVAKLEGKAPAVVEDDPFS